MKHTIQLEMQDLIADVRIDNGAASLVNFATPMDSIEQR